MVVVVVASEVVTVLGPKYRAYVDGEGNGVTHVGVSSLLVKVKIMGPGPI